MISSSEICDDPDVAVSKCRPNESVSLCRVFRFDKTESVSVELSTERGEAGICRTVDLSPVGNLSALLVVPATAGGADCWIVWAGCEGGVIVVRGSIRDPEGRFSLKGAPVQENKLF